LSSPDIVMLIAAADLVDAPVAGNQDAPITRPRPATPPRSNALKNGGAVTTV
jgi:hypothetical protein